MDTSGLLSFSKHRATALAQQVSLAVIHCISCYLHVSGMTPLIRTCATDPVASHEHAHVSNVI